MEASWHLHGLALLSGQKCHGMHTQNTHAMEARSSPDVMMAKNTTIAYTISHADSSK
jgi:hypothetical protein